MAVTANISPAGVRSVELEARLRAAESALAHAREELDEKRDAAAEATLACRDFAYLVEKKVYAKDDPKGAHARELYVQRVAVLQVAARVFEDAEEAADKAWLALDCKRWAEALPILDWQYIGGIPTVQVETSDNPSARRIIEEGLAVSVEATQRLDPHDFEFLIVASHVGGPERLILKISVGVQPMPLAEQLGLAKAGLNEVGLLNALRKGKISVTDRPPETRTENPPAVWTFDGEGLQPRPQVRKVAPRIPNPSAPAGHIFF